MHWIFQTDFPLKTFNKIWNCTQLKCLPIFLSFSSRENMRKEAILKTKKGRNNSQQNNDFNWFSSKKEKLVHIWQFIFIHSNVNNISCIKCSSFCSSLHLHVYLNNLNTQRLTIFYSTILEHIKKTIREEFLIYFKI